jgi:hypothetical protein
MPNSSVGSPYPLTNLNCLRELRLSLAYQVKEFAIF